MISHPPISILALSNHIDSLKASEGAKFSQEYESIEPGQQFTWDNSNLEINKPKNRYANVIAYDHSRVALQTLDGIPGSDYINANYMDGYRKQNAYIATQGPVPETFGDFWRMVWEHRCCTIIMMTKLEERTRVCLDSISCFYIQFPLLNNRLLFKYFTYSSFGYNNLIPFVGEM